MQRVPTGLVGRPSPLRRRATAAPTDCAVDDALSCLAVAGQSHHVHYAGSPQAKASSVARVPRPRGALCPLRGALIGSVIHGLRFVAFSTASAAHCGDSGCREI